ncbi:MAG: cupredoxin family protein [Burkholderiaceae bacterium]|nr:cupredoxin family protein [Burkholderiaceae bacterium]
MKTSKLTLQTLIATACMSMGSLAWSAGTHAHSHGHNQDGGAAPASVIGQPGDVRNVTRTVAVDMADNMRFTPATIDVKANETVQFVVTNSGKVKHEMVLGTPQELAEHYKQMLKFPGMVHEDPQTASVEPGQSGSIVWTFTNAGVVDFACLQPGHFDAGMKGYVTVAR